jgi:hypothetical protein
MKPNNLRATSLSASPSMAIEDTDFVPRSARVSCEVQLADTRDARRPSLLRCQMAAVLAGSADDRCGSQRESRSDSRGGPSSPKFECLGGGATNIEERDGCATFSAETSTHSMECAPREATGATIVTTVHPHVPAPLATPSVNRRVWFAREQRRELGLTGGEDRPGPYAPTVVAGTSNEQQLEPIR